MAVTSHPSGGYRAYKKIAGKEYQYYSYCFDDANKKQVEFDALSQLKPKTVFSSCGRLKGCRINIYRRKGRNPIIIGRIATGPFRNQKSWEIRYTGNFEILWRGIKRDWKEAYKLNSRDMVDYADLISLAKRLYIKDLFKCETEVSEENERIKKSNR